VLVSTTVVEVGVDVPNATIMVVEHAERFGLSQLHQLRGRVGRGAQQSYCFLFAAPKTGETTSQRLEVLEETGDGFKIAEADLEIRGPGEFLGTRQAGGLPFRLANLVRDREWLIRARDDAALLLKEDPELLLPQHSNLRRYYEREGRLQFDRLKTS
jgi:ATP-dependent DNA helicase RecG